MSLVLLGAPGAAGRENRNEAFPKCLRSPGSGEEQGGAAGSTAKTLCWGWEYFQRCFPAGKTELWFFESLCPGQGKLLLRAELWDGAVPTPAGAGKTGEREKREKGKFLKVIQPGRDGRRTQYPGVSPRPGTFHGLR